MLKSAGFGLLRVAGRWGVPVLIAGLLASVGVAAGFVNAQRDPGAQRPILSRIAARQDVRLQRGFDVTVVRIVPVEDGSRMVTVRDRSGSMFQVRLTSESIIKRNGKRVGIEAIRPNQRIAGLARREGDGTVIVGAAIVRPRQPIPALQN